MGGEPGRGRFFAGKGRGREPIESRGHLHMRRHDAGNHNSLIDLEVHPVEREKCRGTAAAGTGGGRMGMRYFWEENKSENDDNRKSGSGKYIFVTGWCRRYMRAAIIP